MCVCVCVLCVCVCVCVCVCGCVWVCVGGGGAGGALTSDLKWGIEEILFLVSLYFFRNSWGLRCPWDTHCPRLLLVTDGPPFCEIRIPDV